MILRGVFSPSISALLELGEKSYLSKTVVKSKSRRVSGFLTLGTWLVKKSLISLGKPLAAKAPSFILSITRLKTARFWGVLAGWSIALILLMALFSIGLKAFREMG